MAEQKSESSVALKPINVQNIMITVEGTTPMIQHQWDEKNRAALRDKHSGKKTKTREARDPQGEAEKATYRTASGDFGVPVSALAKCIIGAAHKDLGIEKTLVRKALFIQCDDPDRIVPMRCADPRVREDTVRVGTGSADLRYRPQFDQWEIDLWFEYNADMLQPQDIVNLVNLAGFGIGIGEWRPEKNGEYGRFRVKTKEEK